MWRAVEGCGIQTSANWFFAETLLYRENCIQISRTCRYFDFFAFLVFRGRAFRIFFELHFRGLQSPSKMLGPPRVTTRLAKTKISLS